MSGPTLRFDLDEVATALGLTVRTCDEQYAPHHYVGASGEVAVVLNRRTPGEVVALVVEPVSDPVRVIGYPSPSEVFGALVSISRPAPERERVELQWGDRAADTFVVGRVDPGAPDDVDLRAGVVRSLAAERDSWAATAERVTGERDDARREVANVEDVRDQTRLALDEARREVAALREQRDEARRSLATERNVPWPATVDRVTAERDEARHEAAALRAERDHLLSQAAARVAVESDPVEAAEVASIAERIIAALQREPDTSGVLPLRREADSVITAAMVDEVNRAENEAAHLAAEVDALPAPYPPGSLGAMFPPGTFSSDVIARMRAHTTPDARQAAEADALSSGWSVAEAQKRMAARQPSAHARFRKATPDEVRASFAPTADEVAESVIKAHTTPHAAHARPFPWGRIGGVEGGRP